MSNSPGSNRFASIPRYEVEGSGPLLIYNAGLDGTGRLFFKQSGTLSKSYRVATYSSREIGNFSYRELTDDIAAIVSDQKESRAIILGESFGGTVALSFALRYPEMTRALVIINSFPRFRQRVLINLGIALTSMVPFPLLWPIRKSANILGLAIDAVAPSDRSVFWEAISTVNAEGYARRLRLIREFNVEERLPEIQSPTLLIAGDRDRVVPSEREACFMASRLPNATLRVIQGAGHAMLMGSQVRISELLNEWNIDRY